MFTIGTGVGGGTVLGGSLYRGATGAAPEIGHPIIGLDLSDGDAAARVGLPAAGLARGARLRARARPAGAGRRRARDPDSFLGKRLAARRRGHRPRRRRRRASEGDEAARRCLRILGERLGIGIANAINLYDPLEVVIGGGVSNAGDLLLEPARRIAFRHVLPGVGTKTKIRLARHGPRAGVLGAALIAAQECEPAEARRAAHEDRAARSTMPGFPLKELVLETLAALGHETVDLGTNSTEPGRLPRHRARARPRSSSAARPSAR